MTDSTNTAHRSDDLIYGVLFDVDGTLLDTYHALEACFHIAYTKVFGHDGSFDAFARTIGKPLSDQLWLYTKDPVKHREFLQAYRAANSTLPDEGKPFAGIVDVVCNLKESGIPVGVVTSKFIASAHRALAKAHIDDLFDCVVGADETAHGKPAPDPIELGARRLGLSAHQCIYVGDSPYDMQAGHAAGAKTVAVAWGQHPLDLLRAEDPDAVAYHVKDLPEIFKSISTDKR